MHDVNNGGLTLEVRPHCRHDPQGRLHRVSRQQLRQVRSPHALQPYLGEKREGLRSTLPKLSLCCRLAAILREFADETSIGSRMPPPFVVRQELVLVVGIVVGVERTRAFLQLDQPLDAAQSILAALLDVICHNRSDNTRSVRRRQHRWKEQHTRYGAADRPERTCQNALR